MICILQPCLHVFVYSCLLVACRLLLVFITSFSKQKNRYGVKNEVTLHVYNFKTIPEIIEYLFLAKGRPMKEMLMRVIQVN